MTIACSYDDAGRLTAYETPHGVWRYTYDVMGNRLTTRFERRPESTDPQRDEVPGA